MEFSTKGFIHAVDFLDLRSDKPEKDKQDFLIYGLFRQRADSGSAETFEQFFTVSDGHLKSFEIPNSVRLTSIYIVSESLFIGTERSGTLRKYKFSQGDQSLVEIAPVLLEAESDFSKMGKITFMDKFFVVMAPAKLPEKKEFLTAFAFDSKTGEELNTLNNLTFSKYSDL
jgi:hypothetical protein